MSGWGCRRVDHRAGQDQPQGAGVALLVGRRTGRPARRCPCAGRPGRGRPDRGRPARPAHRDRVGRSSREPVWPGSSTPSPSRSWRWVATGNAPLHQLPFGRGLEDQPVGGAEHPREDRQSEGGLVVGGRVEDGRRPDPVDEPHRRVVEVRDRRSAASAVRPAAASTSPGSTGPCRSTQRSASAERGPAGSARAATPKRDGTTDRGRRRTAKRTTRTPLTSSSPAGKTSAQVTKSSAQLVRTSTSQPLTRPPGARRTPGPPSPPRR